MATVASGTPVHGQSAPVSGAARWAPATGIAFVVLFVAAFAVNNQPNADASNRKWLDYFASNSNQAKMVISGFLFVFAGLAFLSFVTTLWRRVAAAQGTRGLSPLPVAGATVAAAGLAIGGVLNAVIAGGMIFGSLPEPGAEVLRTTSQSWFPAIAVGGMIPAALALGSIVVQANRVGLISKRLMNLGLVVAVVALASFVFFPMIVLLLWVLALSVIELRRPPAPAMGTPAAK